MSKKSFYITTTLPYVNAQAHMGHALEFVRADIIARYQKRNGFDVFFNTGTDEHGMKILEAAKKSGQSPKEYVDDYSSRFRKLLPLLGVSDEIHFIRTTDVRHEKAAQEFWNRVAKNGYIYKKNYKTKYCIGCEEEKTDSELVNGICPIHPNRALEIIEEENYFFKFSAFADKLLAFYEKNPNFIVPEMRLNEMKEFIKRGLEDFSISRLKSKMPWGVEVPGDGEHVMYVWFDALTNYISTLGWPDSLSDFEKYWVNGTPVQYCGKDNTRFQSVMWQAMLIGADLPNTNRVIVNGFVTGEGGVKMSKSLGNVVDPLDVIREYGTDALRYFVTREIHPFEDSPFSVERLKVAYNANLANGLGNLVSRVMKMATSYGVSEITPVSNKEDLIKTYNENIESFNLQKAADIIWKIIGDADAFIQTQAPFKKIKIDEVGAKKDVAILLGYLDLVSYLLEIFLPETTTKIQDCLKNNVMPKEALFLRKE